MAVDEELLRKIGDLPILRLYDWEGAWVSVGYFGDLEAALVQFGPEVSVVKRPTGGGVVDHRNDLTYTLVIPASHELVRGSRQEAYRIIHQAVAGALRECGMSAELIDHDSQSESPNCFEKAVRWDVVDERGRKQAGAGQRRTKQGLLHQGSVSRPGDKGEIFQKALVAGLATTPSLWTPQR